MRQSRVGEPLQYVILSVAKNLSLPLEERFFTPLEASLRSE